VGLVRAAAVLAFAAVAVIWVPFLSAWNIPLLPTTPGAALGLSVIAAFAICALAWLLGRIALRPRRKSIPPDSL
jgi:hypothetical protein